jgi:hypothetical protein
MSSYTLSSAVSAGIVLTSGGAYKSPFTVTSTGSITDTASPEGYGALTALVHGSATNDGYINGGRYGVYLRNGGLVTNAGTILGTVNGVKGENIIGGTSGSFTYSSYDTTLVNTGYISSSSYGALLNYGGTVINGGSIAASDNGTGVHIRLQPGTVLNTGSISGGIGVQLDQGGYVSNASTGVIQSNGPSSGYGVKFAGGNATLVNAGQITGTYSGVYSRYAAALDIRNSGIITGAGAVSNYGYSAGIWVYKASGVVTIENSGTIGSEQGAGGEAVTLISSVVDLIVDTTGVFIGSVSADAAMSNLLELASGAGAGTLAGVGSQFTGFASIAVDLGASWTIEGDAAGLLNGTKITGLTGRDTIDLTGTLATSDSFNSATGVLTLFDAGHAEIGTLQLGFNTLAPGTSFALSSDGSGGTDITTNAICYLRGTRIVTAKGEIPVEDLREGDLVATRHAGLAPVQWIGRQSYSRHAIAGDQTKLPVHIRAGALGQGQPLRDLFVSPGHSMLVDGVFLLARNLVNGISITQAPGIGGTTGNIDYFQLELAAHDCVLAEGCWSESFADGPGLRAQFDNAEEYIACHPGYREPPQVALCAPRPEQGPALDQAMRMVLARAGTPPAAGPVQGWIDDISAQMVAGWALNEAHPDYPVSLEVWAGTRYLGEALACAYRGDLEAAGKRRGHCAFFFTPQSPLTLSEQVSLQVRPADTEAGLPVAEACRERVQHAA